MDMKNKFRIEISSRIIEITSDGFEGEIHNSPPMTWTGSYGMVVMMQRQLINILVGLNDAAQAKWDEFNKPKAG